MMNRWMMTLIHFMKMGINSRHVKWSRVRAATRKNCARWATGNVSPQMLLYALRAPPNWSLGQLRRLLALSDGAIARLLVTALPGALTLDDSTNGCANKDSRAYLSTAEKPNGQRMKCGLRTPCVPRATAPPWSSWSAPCYACQQPCRAPQRPL